MGWDTLQERRALARLSMMHKITHQLVAIPLNLFRYSPYHITPCGFPLRILMPNAKSSTYQRTFMFAAPSLWNKARLSADTIRDPNPETFRSNIAGLGLSA